MAKPPSDAPVLFDVQSESSTIKQRKDGSYKLVLKEVERVHWVTDNDEAKEGLIKAKTYARNFDEYYGKNAEVSAYQTFTLADGLKEKRKFSISKAKYDQKSKTLVYDIKPKHNNKTDKASHRKDIDNITGNDDSKYGNSAVYSKERSSWRPEWMPDGRGRNLSGQDLRNADLVLAKLHGANLKNADLRDADLRGARLSDTNLMYADLREANLEQASRHHRTTIHNANLMYADLRNANMRGIGAVDSNLMFADLRGVDLSDIDNFQSWRNRTHTQLNRTDWSMANLKGAKIKGARIQRSSFIGANFGNNRSSKNEIRLKNFTFARNLPTAIGQWWRGDNICPDGTMADNNQPCSGDQLIPLA